MRPLWAPNNVFDLTARDRMFYLMHANHISATDQNTPYWLPGGVRHPLDGSGYAG